MDDIELSHNEVMEEKHTVRLIKKKLNQSTQNLSS